MLIYTVVTIYHQRQRSSLFHISSIPFSYSCKKATPFFIYIFKDVSKVIKAYRVPVTISLIGLVFIYWLPKCGLSAGWTWYSRGTTVTPAPVPSRLSTSEHERDVDKASLHIFMSGNKDLGCQEHRRCSPGSIKKKLRHEGFLDEAGFIDSDCVIYNEWKY